MEITFRARAALLLVAISGSIGRAPAEEATVLTPAGTVKLTDALVVDDELYVTADDLTKVSGFIVKPEGACRGDLCIPLSSDAADKTQLEQDGKTYVNVDRLAAKLQQPVVAEVFDRVWSLGEVPAVRKAELQTGQAPDFTLPDRAGRPATLSRYRGKKVLVITWASW